MEHKSFQYRLMKVNDDYGCKKNAKRTTNVS